MTAFLNTWIDGFKLLIVSAVVLKSIQTLKKAHSDEAPISEAIRKVKKYVFVGILSMVLPEMIPILKDAYFQQANGSVKTSNLIAGGGYLVAAARNVLVLMEASVATYHLVAALIQYKMESIENKPIYRNKAIKSVQIGILVITITAVIEAVYTYFA